MCLDEEKLRFCPAVSKVFASFVDVGLCTDLLLVIFWLANVSLWLDLYQQLLIFHALNSTWHHVFLFHLDYVELYLSRNVFTGVRTERRFPINFYKTIVIWWPSDFQIGFIFPSMVHSWCVPNVWITLFWYVLHLSFSLDCVKLFILFIFYLWTLTFSYF